MNIVARSFHQRGFKFNTREILNEHVRGFRLWKLK